MGVPILSASPQLKYVESAVHFKGEADNDSVNKTATVNNQEKAAALNIVYQSPAELGNYHADHEPANVDHQEEEDCCCSASLETNHPAGLRIVNRLPRTTITITTITTINTKSTKNKTRNRRRVSLWLVARGIPSRWGIQANVQKAHLTELRRSLAAHQEEVARYKALVNQLEREKKELLTTSTYPAAIRIPNSV